MADWNPALYSRFEDERTRPARDLLARCRLDGAPGGAGLRIADLGCGPGNSTELLFERFPQAEITGFDTSEAMLTQARRRLPTCRFEQGDIGRFQAERPFDLLFANASLQWVLGHESLVPALFAQVAPGGLLAAQIPDNLAEPSQTAMRAIAAEPEFADFFEGFSEAREAVATRVTYYDWLIREASEVDVWTTVYEHPMESAEAITDWFRSTGLKPFIDRLPERERERFLGRYTQEMTRLYSERADGRRLLAFPRLFFVARRR
ncbi:trans-aconitate 2-methyltransferase [Aureimonas sp. AU20]|uniref:trans-aconitate 2-methyltransferase n=1 Tax=Aureimonas sp. AU20 TaxID=1349819 RepID=UPI00071FB275|nr:trans-aconitate 2-methyltransferase [Aureimonas sp. AU20]ALN74382.1 hypothetical protein M673_16760 [Aureimonas sp. AU20]